MAHKSSVRELSVHEVFAPSGGICGFGGDQVTEAEINFKNEVRIGGPRTTVRGGAVRLS